MSDWVMGRQTLKEIITHTSIRIEKIFIGDGLKNSQEELVKRIQSKNLPCEFVSKDFLKKITGSDSHQGFVAKLKPRRYFREDDFMELVGSKDSLKILALDRIFDPQNMGALFRIAECFGYDGVLFSKNRGCEITPVVSKAASGATELLRLIKVSNLAQALSHFKKKYDFEIVLADISPNTISLLDFKKFSKRTILVLGSEGEGIQPLIKTMADYTVKIPLFGKIESLNVAQAAAIFSFYSCNIWPR